jgi:putative transposase
VLEVKVHGANVADRDGIELLLECAEDRFARLGHLWLDGAYKGRCREWIEKALGWTVEIVQRPPKLVPREVLKVWANGWAKEGVQIEWEKLLPWKGFEILPRRWVVECAFAWLGRNRRMSEDYERLCDTSEALVLVAMTRLMVSRLVRA